MTDQNIANVTKVYKYVRDKMQPEEISMLSNMLYTDVLRMGSERIRQDEEVKLASYRERTSWVNDKKNRNK